MDAQNKWERMEEKIVFSSLFQHIEKDQLQLRVFLHLITIKRGCA
jgi:hypothetical protein